MNNIPKVVEDLIHAQANFDSDAYVNCFSELAVVYDEGKTYTGKREIKEWIEKANQKYKIVMAPLEYLVPGQTLKAEIAGNFPGSPILLNYHFDFINGQIQSLKIV